MKNKRALRCLWLSLLVLTICLVSSGSSWANEKKEILIGAPISMTGKSAMAGQEMLWAYEQAVSDVNKNGGIFVKEFGKKLPARLIAADDESDPGKAAAALERLIKVNKVDLLLSGHPAPIVIPTCIVADKYKKFYPVTTTLPGEWLPNKFQWSTLFTFNPGDAVQVPFQILDTIPESERPKRLALVMEDSMDGRGLGGGFRAMAKKYGYTPNIVMDEPYPLGSKDYSGYILKLQAKNVDSILIVGSNTDCITIVRQMKENDVSVKYMHGWKGTWGSEFWGALDKDAQYILTDGHWSEDFPFPGAKEFGERYTKKYNKYSLRVGVDYALCQMLFTAVEMAGTLDSEKVKQVFLTHEFKGTMMGDVKYGADRIAYYVSTANQWWDGKQRLVFPPVEGGWKVKLAPPWDER